MKKRLILVLIVLSMTLVVSYAGAGYAFSGMIISAPSRDRGGDGPPGGRRGGGLGSEREQANTIALPAPESFQFESLGTTMSATYYANLSGVDGAVILLPGRGGTGSSALRHAPVYWEMGFDVVVFDVRGSGENHGHYQTYGYNDRHDVSAVVDWLCAHANLTPSQVGVMGGSYGSAVALQTLMVRSDLAFVVADSTFSDLSTAVTEHGGRMLGSWTRPFIPSAVFFAGLRADFDPNEVSPLKAAASTDTPILLIHGVEDDMTSSSHSEAVFAQSNEATTELHLTDWGPGHVSSSRHNYEGYREIVHGFLKKHAPQFDSMAKSPPLDS